MVALFLAAQCWLASSPPETLSKPPAATEDPNRTQYFFGTNALFPKPGEVRLSGLFQADTVQALVSGSVGVTRWMSFDVGTVLPIWLVGTRIPNTVVMAKVGGPIRGSFSGAVGIHGLTLVNEGQVSVAGLFFAVGTYARPWGNLSVSVATPFGLGTDMLQLVSPGLTTFSANVRLLPWLSVLSENVYLPLQENNVVLLNAFGLRFIYQKLAVDLGMVGVTAWNSSGVGLLPALPWLGVSRSL